MDFAEKVNGYKTLIGATILILGALNIASTEELTVLFDQIIVVVGGMITVIGIVHKIYKKMTNK